MSANREERRKLAKNMGLKPGETMNLTAIMVQFDNGKAMYLDTDMVQIIDKNTKEPLFQYVLEPIGGESLPQSVLDQQPAAGKVDDPDSYAVQFDTPEGRMEYVKDGSGFSGVRKI